MYIGISIDIEDCLGAVPLIRKYKSLIDHIQFYLDDSSFEENYRNITYVSNTFGKDLSYSFHAFGDVNLADKNTTVRNEWYGKMLQTIDLIERVGGLYVNIHVGYFNPSKQYRDDALALASSEFKKLCEYAFMRNIFIHIENDIPSNDGRERLGASLDDWNILLNIECPNLQMCYDIGHANISFKDAYAYRRFLAKIGSCHIHNNDGVFDSHMPYGEKGTIDLQQVFREFQTQESIYFVLENSLMQYPSALNAINDQRRLMPIQHI